MIKITRNLEDLKKELNQLGPRKKQKHLNTNDSSGDRLTIPQLKRGKTVMKIVKPSEAPQYQANFNIECMNAEELKVHFHRMRANHKYDKVLELILLAVLPITYVAFTIAIIAVFMSH